MYSKRIFLLATDNFECAYIAGTFSNIGIRGFGGTAYTMIYTASGLTTATQSVTPCALIVGNIGPGGGKIFYVAAPAGFNCRPETTEKCYYLEAAPNTWSGASADPTRTWATNANSNQTTAVTGADGTEIGTGYKNSLDIVAQANNVAGTFAAVAARTYTSTVSGTTYNDWFLPSQEELNAFYTNLTTLVGGYVGFY